MIDDLQHIPESQQIAIRDVFTHGALIERYYLNPTATKALDHLQAATGGFLFNLFSPEIGSRQTEIINSPSFSRDLTILLQEVPAPEMRNELVDQVGTPTEMTITAFYTTVQEALTQSSFGKLLHTLRLGNQLGLNTIGHFWKIADHFVQSSQSEEQDFGIRSRKNVRIIDLLEAVDKHIQPQPAIPTQEQTLEPPDPKIATIDDSFNQGPLISADGFPPEILPHLGFLNMSLRPLLDLCRDPNLTTQIYISSVSEETTKTLRKVVENSPSLDLSAFFTPQGIHPHARKAYINSLIEAISVRDVPKLLHTILIGDQLGFSEDTSIVLEIPERFIASNRLLAKADPTLQMQKRRCVLNLLGALTNPINQSQLGVDALDDTA